MRTILFLFILIQAASAFSADVRPNSVKAKKTAARTTTLPDGPGKALVALAEDCGNATREMNGNINKGLGNCAGQKAVKADGQVRTEEILAAMSGPSQGYGEWQDPTKPRIKEPTEAVTDMNGKVFQVSVVTPKEAEALHKKILDSRLNYFRLKHTDTGCVQRAQIISSDLEDMGIATGKIWSQSGYACILGWGCLNPKLHGQEQRTGEWRFHVAPFVLVKNDPKDPNEKPTKWIIDPAFNRYAPRPLDEYRTDLSNSPKWMAEQNITSRFIYGRDQWQYERSKYHPNDLVHARSAIQNVKADLSSGKQDGVPIDTVTPN